jgi:pimeloyl-ACP methyl ester carboxylesterase
LVFLPGVGGTTRYWKNRVAPLATDHRVLLVDLLGFGRSAKPWKRYTIDRHVAALRRTLERLGPVTLVGHSFGAIAALAYAARHPADVSGLVLVSLPCFGSLDRALAYYRGRGLPDRWVMTNVVLAAITCVVTRRVLGRLLPRLLRSLPREVAEDLVLHTWLSSTSTIWDGIYRHDPSVDAARLPGSVPVLLLHGDRDTTAPLGGVTRMAGRRPEWRLHVLPGSDHHPLLRDPVTCRTLVGAFARDAVASRPPT